MEWKVCIVIKNSLKFAPMGFDSVLDVSLKELLDK